MAKELKKKILIHSIVFSPDSVSTAYLYNDIAVELKNNNFEVVVLTTTPHYNNLGNNINNQKLKKKFFGIYYESVFNNINVIHVPLKKYKNTFFRLLSFIYWHIFSILISFKIKKVDFILSPSPPLTIGIVAVFISFFKRAKCVYNVQEIYPDLLVKQGSLNNKFLINIFSLMEKFVYNFSNSVVTIDSVFYSKIKERISNRDKLHIIENFVDTSIYNPDNYSNLPAEFKKNNNDFILTYAGNIGVYQDWEPILYAAKKLKNLNIVFWIIGEGSRKNHLVKQVNKHNLKNIIVYPYQKREMIPSIINHSDCHFISIAEKVNSFGFPSKVYTIMSCKKPLIVISGKESPIYNFLKDKKCAELVDYKNKNEKFVNSIKRIYMDENHRFRLSENGYNEVVKNYSKEKVVKKYTKLFHEL